MKLKKGPENEVASESFSKRKLARESKGSEDIGVSNKCLFRYATKGGGVWLEWKETGHQWTGPEAKGGDPTEGSVLRGLLWKPTPN